MMTHAFLHNLASMNPATAMLCPGIFANSRFVFVTGGSKSGKGGGATSTGDGHKDEDDSKKEKEKEEKEEAEEEKSKKEKKKKEEEKPESGRVEFGAQSFAKRASEAMSTAESIEKGFAASKDVRKRETAEKMGVIGKKIQKLDNEDKENNKDIKSELDRLISKKVITKAQAQELFDADPLQDGFEEKWGKLTAGLPELKKKEPTALAKILDMKKELAKKDEKILEEFKKVHAEFLKESGEIHSDLLKESYRERGKRNLNRAAGLPVEPNQEYVYFDKNGKKQRARIKDVVFEDVVIKDDSGNVIKTVNTDSPVIIVESNNPESGELKEDKFGMPAFFEWLKNGKVSQEIQNVDDLGKNLNVGKLKVGDKFEYHLLIDPVTLKFEGNDQSIEIKKIDEITNEIELDQSVQMDGGRKKILGFGEFARWFRQNEAVRPVDSLEKLRNELGLWNDHQNSKFKREPEQFPPIKANPGEVLQYDDGSNRKFVIKKADDKKVYFDNGESMSLAGFLRWVKREEVEKLTSDSEAKRLSQKIEDKDEKLAEEKRVKDGMEKEMEKRIKQGENPAHVQDLPSTEEPSGLQASYLRRLWDNTTLLSLGDLWEMGKTIVEFGKRKLHRWQHGRIGKFGGKMFETLGKAFKGLSTFGEGLMTDLHGEFKGVAQHAENEAVDHHVKHLETMGIDTVKHHLHEAPDTDTLKAAVTVLCKKGQMRWDDPVFHERINTLSHGMPCAVTKATHLEDIKTVFDHWWGFNTFLEFKNNQASSYNSVKKNFEDDANRLEAIPGGLKLRLQTLMADHLNGRYVNPAEYEEYLHYAISRGKMGFEDKIFFLIMGIAAEGPGEHGHAGMTLLHFDRVGALESEVLNNFPIYDYFTQEKLPECDSDGNPIIGPDGKPKMVDKTNINNFRRWLKQMIEVDYGGPMQNLGNPKDCDWKPNGLFQKFLREEMMWSDATRVRLNKSSGDTSRWDHDDMHMFAPLLTEEGVMQMVRVSGGARQQVSTPGILNAIAGFNEFAKTKLNMVRESLAAGDKQEANRNMKHFLGILRSYIRFSAFLERRYDHTNANITRLGMMEREMKPGVDSKKRVKEHMAELDNFIKGLSAEFGLNEEVGVVYKQYGVAPPKEKAEEQVNMVNRFGQMLEGRVEVYGGGEEINAEKVLQLFDKVQQKTGIISGIGRQAMKGEVTAAKVEDEYKLQPYLDPEVIDRVDRIKKLEKRNIEIGTEDPEKLKAEMSARVNQILTSMENKQYIPQKNDIAALDKRIKELDDKIQTKIQATGGVKEKPDEKAKKDAKK